MLIIHVHPVMRHVDNRHIIERRTGYVRLVTDCRAVEYERDERQRKGLRARQRSRRETVTPLILAVDTSGEHGSLALARAERDQRSPVLARPLEAFRPAVSHGPKSSTATRGPPCEERSCGVG